MSLDLALSIARSGLAHVNRQLAQSASNVANAATPGYTRKEVQGRSITADGLIAGVASQEARRDVDAALVARLDAARAAGAEARARARILEPVDLAHGTLEAGDSIGDLTARLETRFVSLRDSPAEPLRQSSVLHAAQDLAARANAASNAVGQARQAAQDSMVAEVGTLNAELRRIAALTEQIRPLAAQGRSTAELEDQRDAAIATLSSVLEVRAVRQADGGVLLLGRGGLSLPLDKHRDAFSMAPATVGAQAWHGAGGSLPGVLLNGTDVTRSLGAGSLAAHAELRDRTLPRMQAELDVGAAELAARFEEQGLRLFTGDAGAVPDPSTPYATGGWIGFAGSLRVSPAVLSDPSLLRDGTHAVAAVPGGPTAFAPNPPGGPAGFATMIDRVLRHALGPEVSPGNPHLPFATGGLGPDGSLSSTLLSPRSLGDFATQLVATQTAERSAAEAAGREAGGVLTLLEGRFAERSAVNLDTEMATMVTLQNAYAANARLLTAVQRMYDDLLAAVR